MFASDGLDRMRCGTIELSVPLRDDVIQVAARGDGDTQIGRIRVHKGTRTVTVIRVDGKPIQVDITVDGPARTATTRIFREPVHVLRFRRTRDPEGRPRWCAEGQDVRLAHRQGIKQFADTIATFAVRKHEPVAV
jgi:hypothetical protein